MTKDKRLEIRIDADTKDKLTILAKSTTATGTVAELLYDLINDITANVKLHTLTPNTDK